MKHSLKADDPILTAYALGELSREEAAEVAQQLQKNPALQKEVDKIDSLGLTLTQAFGRDAEVKLSSKQRSTIYQSGRNPSPENVISMHKKQWVRPVVVSLSAAAVVALSFTALYNTDGGDVANNINFDKLNKAELLAPISQNTAEWSKSNTSNNAVSKVAASQAIFDDSKKSNIESMSNGLMHYPEQLRTKIKNTAPDQSDPNIVAITENPWTDRASQGMARLPLVCGNASWNWVQQWAKNSSSSSINPNAVRIEEILNQFNYNHPSDIQVGDLSTGVTLVQSPWNAGNQVAIIHVKNNSQFDNYAEAAVIMSEGVKNYRLIGYSNANQPELNQVAPRRVKLASGYSHLVMYEIELSDNAALNDDVLTLSLNTQSASKPASLTSNSLTVQHSNEAWDRAPQDIQFALILASWAQVIADSKLDSTMSETQVLEMATHFKSQFNSSATKSQKDAMKLIIQSL